MEKTVWLEGPLGGLCPPVAFRSRRYQDKFPLLFKFIPAVPVKRGFNARLKSSFLWQDCLQSVRASTWSTSAQLLCRVEGRCWTPHCPRWVFVSVSFAGVVLLFINNHWSRSCSYWPCTELSLTGGCSRWVWVLGKLLLKEVCDGEERGRTCELSEKGML